MCVCLKSLCLDKCTRGYVECECECMCARVYVYVYVFYVSARGHVCMCI